MTVLSRLTAMMVAPDAPPHEVYQLAKEMPYLAACHPNCPLELFWDLAHTYPVIAFSSTVGQMMTLEDPDRYRRLVLQQIHQWLAPEHLHIPGPALDGLAHAIGALYLADVKRLFAQDGVAIPFTLLNAIAHVQRARMDCWQQLRFQGMDVGEVGVRAATAHVQRRLDFSRDGWMWQLFTPFTKISPLEAKDAFIRKHQETHHLDTETWLFALWQTVLPLLSATGSTL